MRMTPDERRSALAQAAQGMGMGTADAEDLEEDFAELEQRAKLAEEAVRVLEREMLDTAELRNPEEPWAQYAYRLAQAALDAEKAGADDA